MRYLRLIAMFIQASAQQELAYRANFWIHLLNAFLNLGTGVLGVSVLFSQISDLKGWNFAAAMTILAVYLLMEALRSLVVAPSFEALAGMEGEIDRGLFDFTLLRPVDTQFFISLRHWNLFSLLDLGLALGVLGYALTRPGQTFTLIQVGGFVLALLAGLAVLYAILLAFAALNFWSPGFLFTWVFDAIFQMARYPVELYPGWLRLVLTWVVPVGVMTTIPVRALNGSLAAGTLAGSVTLALVLVTAASIFFRISLRRYASASS
jgi:ABC-2 type transport system permease protein